MKKFRFSKSVKRMFAGMLAAAVSLSVCVMPVSANDTYEIDTYVPIGSLTDANRDSGSNILNGTNIGGMWYRGKQIDTVEAGYGYAMQINHNGVNAEEGMGKMTFSNITPGGENSDVYSLSFDLKIPSEITLSTTDFIRMDIFKGTSDARAGLIYLIDGMIVICKGGAWMNTGAITDASEGEHGGYVCVPFTKGEWINFELVVDTSGGGYIWYINGDKKSSGTFALENEAIPTGAEAVVRSMNIVYWMTTPASCAFAYMDNVRTAYVTKQSVARDTDMLKAFNDIESEAGMDGDIRYAATSNAEIAAMGDMYGKAVKMNLSGDTDKIVPDQSEGYRATTNRYAISYDIKLNKNTTGLMANAIGGGASHHNGPAVFAKTSESDTTGYLYMSKEANWPTYDYVAETSTATFSVAKYDIGRWMSVSYVVDKTAKTVELYLDGRYVGTTDFSKYTNDVDADVVESICSIQAIWFYNGKEGNTNAEVYVDNFRLSEITDGSFYATGEFTEGAESSTISLTFTEAPSVVDIDDIKVTDALGRAAVITDRQRSGNNIILTTSTKSNMYTVTLPEHMTGTNGNVITGNVLKLYGEGVFVTANQLKADGSVLGSDSLATVEAGSAVTFETAFLNTANTEAEAKRIVLLGAYNADGMLIDVDLATVDVPMGESAASEEQIPSLTKTDDMTTVKGFVWTDGYVPAVQFVQSTAVTGE